MLNLLPVHLMNRTQKTNFSQLWIWWIKCFVNNLKCSDKHCIGFFRILQMPQCGPNIQKRNGHTTVTHSPVPTKKTDPLRPLFIILHLIYYLPRIIATFSCSLLHFSIILGFGNILLPPGKSLVFPEPDRGHFLRQAEDTELGYWPTDSWLRPGTCMYNVRWLKHESQVSRLCFFWLKKFKNQNKTLLLVIEGSFKHLSFWRTF